MAERLGSGESHSGPSLLPSPAIGALASLATEERRGRPCGAGLPWPQAPAFTRCASVRFSGSAVSDSATPWTAARQLALSVVSPGRSTGLGGHQLLQGSSRPGTRPRVPASAGGFFTAGPPGKPAARQIVSKASYWSGFMHVSEIHLSVSVLTSPGKGGEEAKSSNEGPGCRAG